MRDPRRLKKKLPLGLNVPQNKHVPNVCASLRYASTATLSHPVHVMRFVESGLAPMFHAVYKDAKDLMPEVITRVPVRFKWLTACLALAADHWKNDACIKREMALECSKKHMSENSIRMYRAKRDLVHMFLQGGEDGADDGCDDGPELNT